MPYLRSAAASTAAGGAIVSSRAHRDLLVRCAQTLHDPRRKLSSKLSPTMAYCSLPCRANPRVSLTMICAVLCVSRERRQPPPSSNLATASWLTAVGLSTSNKLDWGRSAVEMTPSSANVLGLDANACARTGGGKRESQHY